MKDIFSCIYLGQQTTTILGIMEDNFFFCELRTSQFIILGEKGLNTHARIQTGSSRRSLFLSLFCLLFLYALFKRKKNV